MLFSENQNKLKNMNFHVTEIRIWYIVGMLWKVISNSNHCLFSGLHRLLLEFWLTRAAAAAHRSIGVRSIKVQNVPTCYNMSLHREEWGMWFECGMIFRTLCLTPARWMGSRMQSTVGCFSELCFLQFSVAQVLVGLRKQFINNFVLPTWACPAGFNFLIIVVI